MAGAQGAEGVQGVEVIVVEDDPIVRAWLNAALRSTEFRIAAETSSAGQALAAIERRKTDLLLVDFNLPDRQGTQLVRELRALGVSAPVVLMTSTPREGLNELAREAGAQASVLKTAEGAELLDVLRRVVAGEERFAPEHPRRREGGAPLSAREREVLALVAEGKTNREIGSALGVGEETVKTLLERVYGKLGAHGRLAAVLAAQELGLIDRGGES
jgi:DNA-binding NarL/FixJ family response regulator